MNESFRPDLSMQPKISVIVPVKNGAGTISRCLRSLLDQDYPNVEIIIVNDRSTDDTQAIINSFDPRIACLNSDGTGPSRARNIALTQATGDWVAFTDADCQAAPTWLSELLRGVQCSPGAVSCGGAQRLPADATPFEHDVYSFMQLAGLVSDYVRLSHSSEVMRVRHNPSCNALYHRQSLLDIGGFCEGLWPGEDVDLDYRLEKAGKYMVFNPAAVVFHDKPKTLGRFARMMFSYGFAQQRLVLKHGFFRLVQGIPLLTGLSLLWLVRRVSLRTFPWVVFATISSGMTLSWFSNHFRLILSGLGAWHAGFLAGWLRRN